MNPFILSVSNAMKTMLGIAPERLQPFLKYDTTSQSDISGIIGFADKNISGSLALSFPTETALEVYKLMMGETASSITADVKDVVGELANIVAGGAKTEFSKTGLTFPISLPTVILGKNHTISHKFNVPIVVIPLKINENPFYMEISLKINT